MSQSSNIPSLWPKAIRLDVLSPTTILLHQANSLSELTKGLLTAQLSKVKLAERGGILFEIHAPAIGYSHKLFYVLPVVDDLPYPVDIRWPSQNHQNMCNTQEGFVQTISTIFASEQVSSVLQAMIAKSNEASK